LTATYVEPPQVVRLAKLLGIPGTPLNVDEFSQQHLAWLESHTPK
jgi:hypothetical protein